MRTAIPTRFTTATSSTSRFYDNTVVPYTGTVVITDALTTTLGTYKHSGTITFSPNTPCKSPSAAQQGEPASRIDADGHYYISGIEGVPAGR